jgi:hypothetical protein
MSGTNEISAALLARLFAASPGAAVDPARCELENGPGFTPGATRWYRPTFLPGEPEAAGIGDSAKNRYVGIFQVDIFDPKGKGTKPTDTESERIRACFPRGLSLTASNGVVVNIKKSWAPRVSNQNDAAWYQQIVRVSWTADVSN